MTNTKVKNKEDVFNLVRFNPKEVTGGVKKTLYDEVTTTRDSVTGEIVETAKRSIGKVDRQEQFICLYAAGLSVLTKQNLTSAETKTLLEVLKYTVNNSNMLTLSSDVRRVIAIDSGLKEGTIRTNIKALKDKEILKVKGKTYFLNPLFFGRGDWNNIRMLRQEFKLEYDFVNLEAKEKISTHVLYNDADEAILNSDKQQVLSHYDNGNPTHREEEIIISDIDIDPNKFINTDTYEQQKNIQYDDSDRELELLREKNRTLELEIALKKVSTEELNAKITAKNLGLL